MGNRRGQKGFSLVELMVAGLLLGLAITGVMSMLGVGRTVETDKTLKRQATIIAADTLEDPRYSATNYPLLVKDVLHSITLPTGSGQSIPATVRVTIQDAPAADWNDDGGGTVALPYQTMEVEVGWTMAGSSRSESVILRKSVAEID